MSINRLRSVASIAAPSVAAVVLAEEDDAVAIAKAKAPMAAICSRL